MSYMVEISKVLPLEISTIFFFSISAFTGKKNHIEITISGDFRTKNGNEVLHSQILKSNISKASFFTKIGHMTQKLHEKLAVLDSFLFPNF